MTERCALALPSLSRASFFLRTFSSCEPSLRRSLTSAEWQVGALQLFQVRTNGGRHISALDLSIGDGDELLVAHGSPPPDDVRLSGRDTRRDRDRSLKGRSVDGSPRMQQGSFL